VHHGTLKHQAKHFFYAAGWKKCEPLWDLIIRARQLNRITPVLEGILSNISRDNVERRNRDGCLAQSILAPKAGSSRSNADVTMTDTFDETDAGNDLVQLQLL
jgi:hypothetical protein